MSLAGVKNQQWKPVPNRGTRSEKTTRNVYEAFFVTVFVLSLFLTGCSGSMTSTSQEIGGNPIAQVSGEATLPAVGEPAENSVEAPTATNTGASEASLQSFIQEPAVGERVKLVLGWLKFVSQHAAAERVESGWARLSSGKTIGNLNSNAVEARPDLSTFELMMWRQLLVPSEGDVSFSNASDASKRLEAVALILTMATTPDDVMRVDNVLVVPETIAGY